MHLIKGGIYGNRKVDEEKWSYIKLTEKTFPACENLSGISRLMKVEGEIINANEIQEENQC